MFSPTISANIWLRLKGAGPGREGWRQVSEGEGLPPLLVQVQALALELKYDVNIINWFCSISNPA